MAHKIIGIMGPGEGASHHDNDNAYNIGAHIAKCGHITLTGGRPSGVMEFALKGAKDAGGQTLGILPYGSKDDANPYVDIAIVTAMMSARNNINALTSDILVVCGMDAGTLSELALALKAQKQIIYVNSDQNGHDFLQKMADNNLYFTDQADQACHILDDLLSKLT